MPEAVADVRVEKEGLNFRGLSGERKPAEEFRFCEGQAGDMSLVADVLEGRQLGVIYRNYLHQEACDAIKDNFWRNTFRYSRGADAPAEYLGTYHYRKPLHRYAGESAEANRHLPGLFEGLTNPVEAFRNDLNRELGRRGRRLRQAVCKGQETCRFVMRSWSGEKEFALEAHDDESQCLDPLQDGFEIQTAARRNALGAVNLCLENGSGGLLRMWNIRPDLASKVALGLEVTGSPYPPECLDGIECFDVPIRAGDLYVFDGRFVHAVTILEGHQQTGRATISFLLANLDDRETISWT
ncbi:hypothetical protein [Stappia indica]|uniref:hypothetical protein n=1 Tax=Stappia indica TaxID=538381 RepID=UPI001CD39F92|nr:hypothetical protein [Stappia indica]MCA1298584.1 hypothetical protein [Stappia indica]